MTLVLHARKLKIDFKKLDFGNVNHGFVKSTSLVVTKNVKQIKACAWTAYVKIESFYYNKRRDNLYSQSYFWYF